MKLRFRFLASIICMVLFLGGISRASDEPSILGTKQADPIFQEGDGLAIKGHDPVAYFTEEKPVKGKEEFEHKWMGATWRFASASNRDLFVAEPEKYAPQYGGYCAYGMSQGYAAPIHPYAWSIVDGKLYLNYSLEVRQMWKKNIPGFIRKADENWPKLPKKAL